MKRSEHVSPRGELSIANALVEGSPFALIAMSSEGTILSWNSGAEGLFGVSREEAHGRPFLDLILDPGMRRDAAKILRDACMYGEASGESSCRRRDGVSFPVEVLMKADRDQKDFLVVSVRNITRRREIETALRSSEDHYRTIVETAAEGIWTVTEHGVTSYINRRGAHILGQSSESMLGHAPAEYLLADDRNDTNWLTQMLQTVGVAEGDLRLRRGDGSEVWIHAVVTPIRGEAADSRGMLVLFTDISERKRANDALRNLSSIVQSSNDAIVGETLDGIIQSWNAGATRIYGYLPEEAIGKSITFLAPPELLHESESFLDRIRNGERVEHYTTRRRRKDGQIIEVSQTISPILDAAGSVIGASVIARDITVERRLRVQLDEVARQRQEDLRRFVSSVQDAQEEERHRISRELHDDMGQRLTGLKLKLELLEDDLLGLSPDLLESVAGMKNDVESMIAEVRRISSNLRPSALDDFGLVSALQLLCNEFQRSSSMAVTFSGKPPKGTSKDVEIAVYRIAQEALSNAAHHAAASAVAVELSQQDGIIRLAVEDNGRGFEPGNPAGSKPGRKGLGLVSMSERAQLFGGTFSLISAPGKGTKITVDIPRTREGTYEENPHPDRRRP